MTTGLDYDGLVVLFMFSLVFLNVPLFSAELLCDVVVYQTKCRCMSPTVTIQILSYYQTINNKVHNVENTTQQCLTFINKAYLVKHIHMTLVIYSSSIQSTHLWNKE